MSAGWSVGRGPNGGYIAAMVLRALAATVDDPSRSPRSLTVHFTARPSPGPVRIECRVERSGRSSSTVSARMVQDGRLVALALAAFSGPWPGAEFADKAMPAVAPPGELEPLRTPPLPEFVANFDMRWALGEPPGTGSGVGSPVGGGSAAGSGSIRALAGGWLRFAAPRELDALAATSYLDAWIPSLFSRLGRPVPAPTIDLTVHFRAPLPPAGAGPADHVLGAFSSTTSREGFWEEDGELWSRDGVLLAQSRQLALVLPGG